MEWGLKVQTCFIVLKILSYKYQSPHFAMANCVKFLPI